jgi:hypothetical protein
MPDTETSTDPPNFNKIGETADGDVVEMREIDPDNIPDDVPVEVRKILDAIFGNAEAHPHNHVSDVSFFMGDRAGIDSRVHVSFDTCGLNLPEGRSIRATAIYDYDRLPDEVRDAWLTVVRYLEENLNSDPALFDRLQATCDSTLECDIIVDTEITKI